jgi:hypothetical protein
MKKINQAVYFINIAKCPQDCYRTTGADESVEVEVEKQSEVYEIIDFSSNYLIRPFTMADL